ncbi:MAG: hypothetical protein LBG52_02220 [Candidatus Peribacteria bacterium]|jgi:hypothetical protein|nr:hypothetical protein [Candidatus Peribacteria bacterium]
MRTYGAKGYLVNTYSSQAFSKIAGDNLNTRQGALLTIDENGFLQLA